MAKIPAVPQQELSRISKFPSRRRGPSAGFPAGYFTFLKKTLKNSVNPQKYSILIHYGVPVANIG